MIRWEQSGTREGGVNNCDAGGELEEKQEETLSPSANNNDNDSRNAGQRIV
jgi:hypothetical protein